jgi:hypothetical protein
MNNTDLMAETRDITAVISDYVEGARRGDIALMEQAFHPAAQIFGYVKGEPFFGPIRILFEWDRQNGPAADLESRITSMDVVGTVATVRLELDNWTGIRFTDFFTLCKVEGRWLIMNKVFHRHN